MYKLRNCHIYGAMNSIFNNILFMTKDIVYSIEICDENNEKINASFKHGF